MDAIASDFGVQGHFRKSVGSTAPSLPVEVDRISSPRKTMAVSTKVSENGSLPREHNGVENFSNDLKQEMMESGNELTLALAEVMNYKSMSWMDLSPVVSGNSSVASTSDIITNHVAPAECILNYPSVASSMGISDLMNASPVQSNEKVAEELHIAAPGGLFYVVVILFPFVLFVDNRFCQDKGNVIYFIKKP